MLKNISLRTKVTFLSGCILIIAVIILTLISISNAKTAYGDSYSISFGDSLSLSINDDTVEISGESELSDWLNYFMALEEADNKKSKESTNANQAFLEDSMGAMIFVMVLGIAATYLLVGITLKPIKKLSKKMVKVDENSLCDHINMGARKDEIGSMASSFNKMLDRLHRSFQSQKNFAANAAHELKTPLSTMKAGIQVLQLDKNPDEKDYKGTIQMLEKSTDRLIHVVEDLLNLSSLQESSMEDTILIDEIIDIILDELLLTARQKNITLRTEGSQCIMKGNQVLIYRALFNLIENGIKYNNPGGEVVISQLTDNKTLKIQICDNGFGMSNDELEHIFEPFYRVDKSRSRAMGGSGLGLSIVKTIVTNHGGTLSVSSREGNGSIFTLLFS